MKDLSNDVVLHVKGDELEYIQFKPLMRYSDFMAHCVTTRKGGISTGECGTLNLGFNRNDLRENVMENYSRICGRLGIDYRKLVFSNQIHDNIIRCVSVMDAGKGITRDSDIIGVDGLVTDERNLPIITFYADCVPLILFDPEKKVLCLVHSGWKGTVKRIGGEAVGIMQKEFGSNPSVIIACIGPSIGRCCFEVDHPVAMEFKENFNGMEIGRFIDKMESGKFHIALWDVNREILVQSGLNRRNIYISNICTVCNKDLFFSHRGAKGKTGSLAAIAMLK